MKIKLYLMILVAFGIWHYWDRINAPDMSHVPEGEVTLYVSASCGELCDDARETLTLFKVPFEEYDVELSEQGKKIKNKHNLCCFPVVIFGDRVEIGYSEKGFTYILNDRYPRSD